MTPASRAAAPLVGLMATESWDKFKEVAAALWSRVSPEQTAAASAELAQTRLAVLGARDGATAAHFSKQLPEDKALPGANVGTTATSHDPGRAYQAATR